MDLGSVVNSVAGYANQAQAFVGGGVAASPSATPAAAPEAQKGWALDSMASKGALGFVALYFVLRFTGLLPRWAKII